MTLPPGWIDASLVGSPDVSYIQMSSLECDDVPFVIAHWLSGRILPGS